MGLDSQVTNMKYNVTELARQVELPHHRHDLKPNTNMAESLVQRKETGHRQNVSVNHTSVVTPKVFDRTLPQFEQ